MKKELEKIKSGEELVNSLSDSQIRASLLMFQRDKPFIFIQIPDNEKREKHSQYVDEFIQKLFDKNDM
ncbi:MAG: hypothetical protein ACI4Q5_09875 [Porcipelethomonas sp.]